MTTDALHPGFGFSFQALRKQFATALRSGYQVLTCEGYAIQKNELRGVRTLVNRVDIDVSCKKARRLGEIFNDLNIQGTFFVRLHAREYNPFAFEEYRCLKFLRDSGHEIGFHSEVVDEAAIWGEDPEKCLKRDIAVLESMLEVRVRGVASHGGTTGLNNLDFWNERKPKEFGLLYEAYDKEPEFNLFSESWYVSDSSWTRWKCYDRGKLVEGNEKTLAEHALDGHPLIYSLIHPETYYDRHFYE
jgi:hypothetical protein